MAAGVVLVVAALVVVQLASPTPAPASTELTVGGPADVTIQTATYEPGQTSGWHVHTGMHAVLVLSGTVTFYDGQCQGRTYGPGETYVGGQETHVVRNETAESAQLAVTYLFPVGQPHTTFHVDSPAPAGCDASQGE
jgi:quercetin dioxygenase-like cupin family protein